MTRRTGHWDEVYRTKAPDQVSWFQSSAAMSLAFIRATHIPSDAAILDVGGGASVLSGELLAEGFRDVSVLDIAETALAANRTRLGARGADIHWLPADVLTWTPARAYDLWHDRAVFHFLTDLKDRARYRSVLSKALKPGGTLIVATFALDGPERCSGLPVQRWSAEGLSEEFGREYRLVESAREAHRTPGGSDQAFTWCRFSRV